MPSIFGQADVEDDDVVGLGLAEEVAFLAVACRIDGKARIGEGRHELAVEIGIVLDNQGAHGRKLLSISAVWPSISRSCLARPPALPPVCWTLSAETAAVRRR